MIGRWPESPFGSFADAMVETRDGHRTLLAPTDVVADFVSATYNFDDVRIEPIWVDATSTQWRVDSPSLQLNIGIGGRRPIGVLLRPVPTRVLASTAWATMCNPVARVLMRGVRTKGQARTGRTEWYGALDVHAVVDIDGRFDGQRLGDLALVEPPCHFGFSSTPRRPSVTTVVTTVEYAARDDA